MKGKPKLYLFYKYQLNTYLEKPKSPPITTTPPRDGDVGGVALVWFVGVAPLPKPEDPTPESDTVTLVGVFKRRFTGKLTIL